MNIIQKFQDMIIDNNTKYIEYNYTSVNDLYVLHIYNPYLENINIKYYNSKQKKMLYKLFYIKLSKMLFDKNKNTKKGCFNYEHMNNNDPLYYTNHSDMINRFLKIKYTFILIDKKFNPVSLLAVDNNTIYNVCTNILERNKNYMTILLGHILRLIKLNKLNTNVDYFDLKLNIRHDNPYKDKLIEFYRKFNFTNINYKNGIYITMYIK